MDINTIMKELENRLDKLGLTKSDLAEHFGMTYKGVWGWFNDKAIIPFDKLIKLVDMANAEIIIRDKHTKEVIVGILSERDIEDAKERERFRKIKQALSMLSEALQEEG